MALFQCGVLEIAFHRVVPGAWIRFVDLDLLRHAPELGICSSTATSTLKEGVVERISEHLSEHHSQRFAIRGKPFPPQQWIGFDAVR